MKLFYLSVLAIFGLQVARAQIQLQSFEPTFDYSGKEFGSQVAIDVNGILAATASTDTSPGKVYLFNTSLEQQQVFYPNDAAIDDAFGSSFSIDGDFIAIGSYNHDTGATDAGAVYIYKKNSGNYTLFQKITATDLVPEQRLGRMVLLQDGFLYVTSALQVETDARGAVYVYKFDGVQWVFTQKLTTIGHPVQYTGQIASLGGKISVGSGLMMVFNYPYATRFSWENDHWEYQNATYVAPTKLGSLGIADIVYSEAERFILSEAKVGMYCGIDNLLPPYISTDFGLPIEIGGQYFGYNSLAASGGNLFVSGVYVDISHKWPVFYYKKIGAEWNFQSILYGDATDETSDYFGVSMATKANMAVFGARLEGNGKAYFASEAALKNEHFSKDKIEIYPNPVQDILNVKSDFVVVSHAEVYSLTGKLLLSLDNHPSQLDISQLDSGLYFLKITSDSASQQTFKIVKN